MQEDTVPSRSRGIAQDEPASAWKPEPPDILPGMGKYINPAAMKQAAEEEPSTSTAILMTKKKPSWGFEDFSSW